MRIMTTTEALREALREELLRDERIILLGEDIGLYGGAFGVTRGLIQEFGPDRIINTPISESSFVGVAIGAAVAGLRPVVEIMFMDFITLAMDQLVNQAAKLRYVFGPRAACPIVIRTACGGGRCYGPTHSQTLEAWFVHVPGLKIVAPSSPADAKGLLKTAIRDRNPVIFLEHKMIYGQRGPVPQSRNHTVPFGKARVLRKGTDLTMVAWSWMSIQCTRAAEALQQHGIAAEVIDLRTLNPLDIDTVVESVKKTGRALIAEEGTQAGGVSAEIGFRIFEQAYDYLDAPLCRVCGREVPIPASEPLEQAALPNWQTITHRALELCRK
ncbi:MAG: alpha-ketoacid dehydrogenase subunit beta [Kiritimatiellae bacterium]|nr:alpha-ketoacid dehydrogenase subunit beta [Kiritimatiellia bacterium]